MSSHPLPVLSLILPLLQGSAPALDACPDGAGRPIPVRNGGLPLLIVEDFESGAERWEPTDPAAWEIREDAGSRVYALVRESRYTPPVRSPFSISLLKDLNVAGFVLDASMKQTGREYNHRDMVVVFGYQSPSRFYYAHIASRSDPTANSIMRVNDEPRVSIAGERNDGTKWIDGRYHHVRVARDCESGSIRVYFDDMENPIMTATDRTFLSGRIGFGSFDDTGNIDNVVLWGEVPEEEHQEPRDAE